MTTEKKLHWKTRAAMEARAKREDANLPLVLDKPSIGTENFVQMEHDAFIEATQPAVDAAASIVETLHPTPGQAINLAMARTPYDIAKEGELTDRIEILRGMSEHKDVPSMKVLIADLTSWFLPQVLPARVGPYKIKQELWAGHDDHEVHIGYSYWNGKSWGPVWDKPENALPHTGVFTTNLYYWRGLTVEPEEDQL